ncbi:hypothetical protein [Roseiconus lacunae]|uniref:Uncharacterized protein n=1 Tax=Roseiconus lacunae TaxID=2605694 RepID=A0ABT7PR92_9BACT|nr:hypothetical protein [Roseiconus lacunae]MDM4019035.1 hypothetical protein [Roseiconus lacunae]
MNGPNSESSDQSIPPQVDQSNVSSDQAPPFVAKLVAQPNEPESHARHAGEESGGEEIRVGSPFRVDPPPSTTGRSSRTGSGEAAYADFGPFLYTSMGAATAALTIVIFAALGYFWFPAGGVLVTMLGTGLSLIGLFSNKRFRLAALAALPIHLGLFFLCYSQALV